jgi:hypothetical protein
MSAIRNGIWTGLSISNCIYILRPCMWISFVRMKRSNIVYKYTTISSVTRNYLKILSIKSHESLIIFRRLRFLYLKSCLGKFIQGRTRQQTEPFETFFRSKNGAFVPELKPKNIVYFLNFFAPWTRYY